MKRERLELALERLSASTWRRLETFASEFLSAEFPNLRSTASPSGDGGRDAEIINFVDDPTHVLQYSVANDWTQKIKGTVKRLSETNSSVQMLTYVTNIQIGANADEIKRELRANHKIFLDVRDRNYFLDRFRNSTGTEKAAEALARDMVDPLLQEAGVIKQQAAVLTDEEAKAALLLLSLQLKDDTQEKGLTKLCFEALVHTALLGTTSNHRMKREAVLQKVCELLPRSDNAHVRELANNALQRLTKKFIRHHRPTDDFCLTHEEVSRVKTYSEEKDLQEIELQAEIEQVVRAVVGSEIAPEETKALAVRTRRIIERCIYARAELFASAVIENDTSTFAGDHIESIVTADQKEHIPPKGSHESDPNILQSIVREVLRGGGKQIEDYLADLSNAYTLMAFLSSTPDVQRALQKIFSHGEIFLDTTVLLPLVAELCLEEEGNFQRIVRIASEAGIEFFVTDGVLEELASHMNRCKAYARGSYSIWEGGVPFLFQAYVAAGADPGEFRNWVEEFTGETRPTEDLAAFLAERFTIIRASLESDVLTAPNDLRFAVDQIWADIHERRRERHGENNRLDPLTIVRLAKHDTENYVGVIQRRRRETSSALGYSVWWLTFDKLALKVGSLLRQKHGITPPASPVLSLDFLSQCLVLGPLRTKLTKDAAQSVPMMIDPRNVAFLTPELLEEARSIRKEMSGASERVIARRVRDRLDSARQRMGPLAERGVDGFFDALSMRASSDDNTR